ncbi:MAG TPA: hypothetical protein VM599_08000, partial [Thermoanaerobaculia bacterium]|nr:hypothetical protein [Thermoanaerobaculia bacterium]
GCGCGALMAGALALIMGLAWFGYGKGERFKESLRDPASRAAATREVLRYRELPAGYHPMGGFSIPLAMEMAMLSDRDPPPGEEVAGPDEAFDRRGFVYLATHASGRQVEELRAYFRGERDRARFYQEIDQRFERGEVLGRGRIEAGGAEVLYVVELGRMELGEGPAPTVLARLLVECPEASRLQTAMWFEPAPPAGSAAESGYDGSPGDPAALKSFLDHFRLCET